MNGSHIAGLGIGAILGTILAGLGAKIGLQLTHADASMLGVACVGVGLAVGHAAGKAWTGPGILPSLRRGFLGAKSSAR